MSGLGLMMVRADGMMLLGTVLVGVALYIAGRIVRYRDLTR